MKKRMSLCWTSAFLLTVAFALDHFLRHDHLLSIIGHVPCALVVEPNRERHRDVGNVVIVEPITETEFQCVEAGGYCAHERREEDILAARVLFLFVYINLDHEEHQEQPVKRVHFHNPEIKGNKRQYKKYDEFEIVQPTQNEPVPTVKEWFDMPYRRTFEQGHGDHAREPAWYFTDFAGHVQKTMAQDSSDSRGNRHEKKEVLDLLIHAVRPPEFVEMGKSVDTHSRHYQARQYGRGLHNGYSE